MHLGKLTSSRELFSCSERPCLRSSLLLKPVQEGKLPLQDVRARLRKREPLASVRLGNLESTSAAGRPLDRAMIAHQLGWIAISFKRPGADDLSARLLNGAEIDPDGLVGRRCRKSRLFGKLPNCSRKRWFIIFIFTLRQRPCS
jgi:hypothetical protein